MPSIERLFTTVIGLFFFLLPWQTIFILEERYLDGSKWEHGTIAIYVTEVLAWLSIALYLLWRRRAHQQSTHRQIWYVLVIFIGYSFLSIFWSTDRTLASQYARWILEASTLFFILIKQQTLHRHVAFWFIAGSTVQSIFGLWQFLTQSTFSSSLLGLSLHPTWQAGTSIVDTLHDGRWLRAYGAFSHPNMFAGYLLIAIIIIDLLLLTTKKNKFRPLLPVISLLHVACIVFTWSRTALIGLAIWSVISFFIHHHRFLFRSILYRLFLITTLLYVFSPLFHTRTTAKTQAEGRSIYERVYGYADAWGTIRGHPFIGVGVGNATTILQSRIPDRAGWVYQPPHSVPLLFLMELGLVGAIIFLMVFLYYRQATGVTMSPLVPIVPIILGDHYLFSSYVGLILVALFLGIIPTLSTGVPHEN